MAHRLMVIGYEDPLEERFMLGDVDWLEELDPSRKYEFWYDKEVDRWVCHIEIRSDNE